MKNPEYVLIDDTKYKINTDFRIALKCEEAAQDDELNDIERAYAILYLLFGDEGINNTRHYERLLECAKKYLSCGVDIKSIDKNSKPDMNYQQDWRYIVASFRGDYGIDLTTEKLHWWTFYSLMSGLSSESVINRIREIRTTNLSEIKDAKERNKMKKLQETYALKTDPVEMTEEQRRSVDKFYELTGIERK